MDAIFDFLSYASTRLPLILTFATGYIVYLVLANTKLTDVFVWWSLKRSGGNLKCLLAYIIGVAALLSFFIPNAITVLTLLPFLKAIEKDITPVRDQNHDGRLTTALTLSVIYGANIGGMGSLIGSPANLLLVGALDLYEVSGREQISFLNWFFWSVPLVIFFVAAAWALIATFGVSGTMKKTSAKVGYTERPIRLSEEQKRGGALFLFFLAFWISVGVAKEMFSVFGRVEPYVCTGFFVFFVYLSFVKSFGKGRTPVLRVKHLMSGLPKRGLVFLAIVLLLIPVIRVFQLDEQAARMFSGFFGVGTSSFWVFFGTTLGVIFLTEVLSNTVVSTAFFPLAFLAAPAFNIPPLILMIAVSIASTCAFMTPVATPCNALAFGEMKKTSLGKMLILGLPLNVIGALLITLWLRFVIPLVYS